MVAIHADKCNKTESRVKRSHKLAPSLTTTARLMSFVQWMFSQRWAHENCIKEKTINNVSHDVRVCVRKVPEQVHVQNFPWDRN